jgi:hypothetical protein
MGDYGVAVTWGDAKAGRDQKALELWADAVTQNDKAVADSRIERWDAIVFEPSGSPPAGVVRFYGTREQIEAWIQADDFQETMMRGGLLLNAFGYRRFMTGDALAQGLARFAQAISTL